MKRALLVIDLQNDYFPGGKYELSGIEEASSKASDLIHFYRENNLPIFHIQHISEDPEDGFFLKGTPGVEINERARPLDSETLIQKPAPNSFLMTSLKASLEEESIQQLVVCGAMSHMCVDATTRAALDFGYEVTVIEDACATCDLEFNGKTIPSESVHGAFMTALEDAGASVSSLENFLS